MRKLAFGALFVGLMVACGGGGSGKDVHLVDTAGGSDAAGAACNVLTQTGCNTGEKCSWILDSSTLGHVGCAPDGTVAVAAACTYGSPGATGYDNCTKGNVCISGVCKEICDQNGGSPTCDAQHSCQVYSAFLGPEGSEMAGVCDTLCNPLADNDFDGSGSGTKTGTACGSGEGCYGFWSSAAVTHFSCSRIPSGSVALFNRSLCSTASGCANSSGSPYLNGCAGGYMPLITDDTTGMSTYSCRAFCQPENCSTAGCPSAVGMAPHRCNNTDAAGDFSDVTTSCTYGWWFEEGSDGSVLKSPYSDTTGICLEKDKFHLGDVTGMNTSTTNWPLCKNMAGSGAGSNCYGAFGSGGSDESGCYGADFGCVDLATSGIPSHFQAQKPAVWIPRPRLPYHAVNGLDPKQMF